MSDATASYTYLSLAAARALECNGCGDCCDSRRTGGYWRWGALPPDQYADSATGSPLIVPIELVVGSWRDRAYRDEDALSLSGTPFRCTAFRPDDDGRGSCARHDQSRPAVCGDFPVGGVAIEEELALHGSVKLETSAFPRCTWYRVVVVADDERAQGLPRAEYGAPKETP